MAHTAGPLAAAKADPFFAATDLPQNPPPLFFRNLLKWSFGVPTIVHAYGRPTAGHPHDCRSARTRRAWDFFSRWCGGVRVPSGRLHVRLP